MEEILKDSLVKGIEQGKTEIKELKKSIRKRKQEIERLQKWLELEEYELEQAERITKKLQKRLKEEN